MVFPLMKVRSVNDTRGDALFPDLASSSSRVTELGEGDGVPLSFVARGVSVVRVGDGAGRQQVLRLNQVRVDVDVTDGRVVIGCAKYDKGGGWWGIGGGGAAFALVANVVSKIRAANRSRGTALVGQVRYAWVREVAAFPKRGLFDTEEVALSVKEGTADGGAVVVVNLVLPKEVSSEAVARAVIHRAARWRLAQDRSIGDSERPALELLVGADLLTVPASSKSASYTMPSSFPVSAASAFGPLGQAPSTIDPHGPQTAVS